MGDEILEGGCKVLNCSWQRVAMNWLKHKHIDVGRMPIVNLLVSSDIYSLYICVCVILNTRGLQHSKHINL